MIAAFWLFTKYIYFSFTVVA